MLARRDDFDPEPVLATQNFERDFSCEELFAYLTDL
jgi:hypothetical protein